MEEHDLTPRQQWFRRLLDELYEIDRNASLSQQQVYDRYQCDLAKGENVVYPEMVEDENEHNSGALRAIRADFRCIKVKNTGGIYISSPKGYKRATREEAYPYLLKRYHFIRRLDKDFWEQVDRYDSDGQMKLQFTKYQSDTKDPFKTVGKED